MRVFKLIGVLGCLSLAVAFAGCGGAELGAVAPARSSAPDSPAPLVVHRGDFTETLLLTGELVADQGFEVAVPKTPSYQVQVRWLIEDGSEVKVGDRLVELDNSSFANNLEERRLTLSQTRNQIAQRKAQLKVEEADRRYALAGKRADLAKARDQAEIPAQLLPRREVVENQLALRRAELELEKATDDLVSQQGAAVAEMADKQVELNTLRRDIEVAERSILELTARSPAKGIAVVANHPWEGRKLQEGETVWVGMPLVRLPDLESMIIEAFLPDVDDGRLKVGAPVRLTLDAFPAESFAGQVRELAQIARQEPGESLRYFFRLVIDPERVDVERMRPGMSVKVEAQGRSYSDVLLVPRAALASGEDGRPTVLLASGERRAVELGPCDRNQCVIEDGLEQGVSVSEAPEAYRGGGA